jgi:hypothetical protein
VRKEKPDDGRGRGVLSDADSSTACNADADSTFVSFKKLNPEEGADSTTASTAGTSADDTDGGGGGTAADVDDGDGDRKEKPLVAGAEAEDSSSFFLSAPPLISRPPNMMNFDRLIYVMCCYSVVARKKVSLNAN